MRYLFEDLAFLLKLTLVASCGLWLVGARAADAPSVRGSAPAVTASSPAPAR
ncbi:hypothetical protein [Methylobacterium nodulans]|uniref:Uncharacterized protein n=1 Tax=Methylobacterium nodulans (strain LMG 21967 / CNCM I-2342 / ORS 2060) TaxID=460265 RepID=B8ISW2_METNO|nr:hypothetical protein [Methylobacterium nodulans]ACL60761.1 hypothetical protein Mnod_5933 [Methylobacterium nodulans ORS 2060]